MYGWLRSIPASRSAIAEGASSAFGVDFEKLQVASFDGPGAS